MKAIMIAVGDELLDGSVTDTNSNVVASLLSPAGFTLERKAVVRDRQDDITAALGGAVLSADLVVMTGGLGPTADDLTRESASAFLGRKLVRDERILEALKERFAKHGFPFTDGNARQADVIEGAIVLENPKGTAPGFFVPGENGRAGIAAFPGVPFEFEPMFGKFAENITRYFPAAAKVSRVVLKTTGLPESFVDDWVVKSGLDGLRFGTVCGLGEVLLRFESDGSPDELAGRVEKIFGTNPDIRRKIYSRSEDETLAAAVLAKFRERGMKLALAESCTGGLVSKLVTDVPGSSDVFLGGAVSYANALKANILGVKPETLERFGAVSFETAYEMARGLLDPALPVGAARPDVALSVTGIAGPSGGSLPGTRENADGKQKPVGTVFIGLAGAGLDSVYRFQFHGDRSGVRSRTAAKALEILWDAAAYGEVRTDLLYSLADFKIYGRK